MKKVFVFSFVCMLLVAVPAMSTTVSVDFGTTAGETVAGVTLSGWGEVEPTTSGGGYGGFKTGGDNYVAPTTPTADHLCKMVWGSANYEGETGNWAEVIFSTDIDSVTIRHLDGSESDSFDVRVDGELWGSYDAPAAGKAFPEQWFETTFSGLAGSTLTITITEPAGQWRLGYGQLGIDRLEATVVPDPATVCLLGFGVLLLRRRKTV